ncbi:hypothetical protein D0U04_21725 [Bacillus clarus]|uniref:Putative membrane protein n=1 Tax=Bacillus clarus TaxID=2338372 RepID=A0A090Y8M7_9BACI|nr:hypothetical protein [Bacillus clarus]KFM94839.1 putative membrane protein [Bacillus clarus]RFT64502.1 hypothetical protein D0U04_21725 [Bacillus clarus]
MVEWLLMLLVLLGICVLIAVPFLLLELADYMDANPVPDWIQTITQFLFGWEPHMFHPYISLTIKIIAVVGMIVAAIYFWIRYKEENNAFAQLLAYGFGAVSAYWLVVNLIIKPTTAYIANLFQPIGGGGSGLLLLLVLGVILYNTKKA